VTPICPLPKAQVSASSFMSSDFTSPIFALQRWSGMMKGLRDMDSAPPATANSESPSIRDCAAETTA